MCEVKSSPNVKRFRIFKNETFHIDGSDKQFTSMDDLLEHYTQNSPRMKHAPLFIKKPLLRPAKLKATRYSSEEDEDPCGLAIPKSTTTKNLLYKLESLQKLINEKETIGTEIREQYLDEQLEKIGNLIPKGQSVQEVWHRERGAIKRSLRKSILCGHEINEVAPGDKMRQTFEQKNKKEVAGASDTEKLIMQSYVDINGRNLELKVRMEGQFYLVVRFNALYNELKNEVNDTLRGYQEKTTDAMVQHMNVQQKMAWQNETENKITDLERIVSEVSKLGQRIQMIFKNVKNQSWELNEEAGRQWNEQWSLRYVPGELESMRHVVSLVTQEMEQKMQEIEKLLDETTEIDNDIRMTIELIEKHKERFKAKCKY